MRPHHHNLAIKGLIICGLASPATLSAAASGCVTGQLLGLYNAELLNANTQSLMQDANAAVAAAATPAASTTTPKAAGLAANDSSLTGNTPALGRYYFDAAGNIVGLSTGKVQFNIAVGKYTVNTDCTGRITLSSGAAYDFVVSNGGRDLTYVRTDADGGGNIGVLRRGGSCLSLNYPNGFTFAVAGGSKQTDSTGATLFAPYSVIGVINVDGKGQFNLSESIYKTGGVVRSTASGTYTVGADCSVSLKFSTAAGANSSNFVAPSSFRALMVNSATGLLAIQPDANTTLTGTLSAQ
ncbi:MAG TPA: hypothetical protein VKE70_13095 [Candidatus Solibacter sp.]|nr:hypothetical protein [Candidatus Solibacter sp.]